MKPIKSILVVWAFLVLTACASPNRTPQPDTPQGNTPVPAGTATTASAAWENAVWQLESFGDPLNPTPVAPGTQVTVLFDNSNGVVSGSGGCNTYSGGYTLNGERLTVSKLASTLMACAKPVMDQETTYLKALQEALSYRVELGKLQITVAGSQVLTFVSAQTQGPALEGTLWQLQAYGDQATLMNLVPNSQVTATFNSAVGKVAGSGGCNTYSAHYQVDGARLSVTDPVTTKMACPQPLMDQEAAFLQDLQSAQSFKIRAGSLTILCAGGKVLIFIPVG